MMKRITQIPATKCQQSSAASKGKGLWLVTLPPGERDCHQTINIIIVPKVTNDEAKKIYPDGWETIKPYLRKVPDPNK